MVLVRQKESEIRVAPAGIRDPVIQMIGSLKGDGMALADAAHLVVGKRLFADNTFFPRNGVHRHVLDVGARSLHGS